jgi:uncharacterized membrane protein YidH (DUF202 family)
MTTGRPGPEQAPDPPFPIRPDQAGGGLQPERTALAWERTAIAMMVAGAVLAKQAASGLHFTLGLIGVGEVVAGGMLLAWAGRHSTELHDPEAPPQAVPQVGMARLVGIGAMVLNGTALILGILAIVARFAP